MNPSRSRVVGAQGVPLRQVAELHPVDEQGKISHRGS